MTELLVFLEDDREYQLIPVTSTSMIACSLSQTSMSNPSEPTIATGPYPGWELDCVDELDENDTLYSVAERYQASSAQRDYWTHDTPPLQPFFTLSPPAM